MATPTKYSYSISSSTANGRVNSSDLENEIQASSIVTALDRIDTGGDNLDIWFKDVLAAGDVTILTGVVNAHAGQESTSSASPGPVSVTPDTKATYSAEASGVGAANRIHIAVFNPSGSGKVLRVYRCWILQDFTTNQGTTVNIAWEGRRCTGCSGGTSITPVKRDSARVDSAAMIAKAPTITDDALYRSWADQINSYGSPFDHRIDFPFGDVVEPIVLRPGQGFYMKQITATSTPTFRVGVEWTEDST